MASLPSQLPQEHEMALRVEDRRLEMAGEKVYSGELAVYFLL